MDKSERGRRVILSDEERARSTRILFTAFPDGVNLEDEIRRRQLSTMTAPSGDYKEFIIDKRKKNKVGGLVFRAAIKAIHVYQSVSRRLAK